MNIKKWKVRRTVHQYDTNLTKSQIGWSEVVGPLGETMRLINAHKGNWRERAHHRHQGHGSPCYCLGGNQQELSFPFLHQAEDILPLVLGHVGVETDALNAMGKACHLDLKINGSIFQH